MQKPVVIAALVAGTFLISCRPKQTENRRTPGFQGAASATTEDSQPPSTPVNESNESTARQDPITESTTEDRESYQIPDRASTVEEGIKDSGRSAIVMSSDQLHRAITQCFGDGFTTIAEESIMSIDGTRPDAFLLPKLYMSGENILDRIRPSIDGDLSAAATGARVAQATPAYLSSLQIVANVVAHNCALRPTEGRCTCGDTTSARTLLERCFPQYSWRESERVNQLATTCQSDPKGAIASIVGSIGFVLIP